MKYRLTCLTPLLVGDGNRLSAIDYMVWKDQVNVLDQRRILRQENDCQPLLALEAVEQADNGVAL